MAFIFPANFFHYGFSRYCVVSRDWKNICGWYTRLLFNIFNKLFFIQPSRSATNIPAWRSLNTVTKSSNSSIQLLIAISRVEELSTRLLTVKKDTLALQFSTWTGQLCFKDNEIPLFALLPQNIVMPTKNLRLVLVLLSQFKMAEEN